MPGFNGTGPQGNGPMTGGVRGYCNPGYTRNTFAYGRVNGMGRGFRGGSGSGFGFGCGYGRGIGRRGLFAQVGGWYGTINPYVNHYNMKPEDELSMLKDEATAINNELESINRRIEEIESQS